MKPPERGAGSRWSRLRRKPWWPWAKRIAIGGFALFVVTMLVINARAIEWSEVFVAVRAYPLRTLAIAFVSYAFNLNLGTVVGAVAMRVRLYTRLGLDGADVARIVGASMLTNWLGYMLLAGLAFLWWPLALPADWHVGVGALHVAGGVLVAVVLGYVAMCAFSTRREWTVRGQEIALPSFRVALVQLAISSANWALMGATMHALLQGKVAYPLVLGVLLIGAVAGLVSRVPAGLGVLEAVFVALLASQMAQPALIAGVLLYRAFYYWAPLLVAGLLYLAMEASAKRLAATGSAA